MNIYEINDCDKVCANSVEEAARIYKEFTGEEVAIEDIEEIADESLDKMYVWDDETMKSKKTFREALKEFSEPGFFCSTEF